MTEMHSEYISSIFTLSMLNELLSRSMVIPRHVKTLEGEVSIAEYQEGIEWLNYG